MVLRHSQVRRHRGDVAPVRGGKEVLGEGNLWLGRAVCKHQTEDGLFSRAETWNQSATEEKALTERTNLPGNLPVISTVSSNSHTLP